MSQRRASNICRESAPFYEVALTILRLMSGVPPGRQPYSLERVREILGDNPRVINRQDVNETLAYLGLGAISEPGFTALFGSDHIRDLVHLEEGANRLRQYSLLFHGNFRQGFETVRITTNLRIFDRAAWDVPSVRTRSSPVDRIEPLNAAESQACGYLATDSGLSERRINSARKKGEVNTHRYLAIEAVDVYIAGSMRTAADFEHAADFATAVLQNPILKGLGLIFFNPLWAFMDDSHQKGLLEQLMLKKASVMLYMAGDQDSFGKDSELASMLVQGKPVVVYVPTSGDPEESSRLDARYNMFNRHPLAMQCTTGTGVANGVMVARSPEACARILSRLFLHTVEFTIDDSDEANVFLLENETNSKVRIVTRNEYLTDSFWNQYQSQNWHSTRSSE